MLYWHNLLPDEYYVIDLVQLPNGDRHLHFRVSTDQPHEFAALSSDSHLGSHIKGLGPGGRLSLNITVTGCLLFVLDPHDIWMTEEENLYWCKNRSQASLVDPDAPWLNHLPPKFAPK